MRTSPPSPLFRRLALWLGIIAIITLSFWGWTQFGASGHNAPRSPRSVPVRVGTVTQTDVPRYLTGLGTVQPSGSVLVRSRVDGELVRLHFSEGQRVKAGDLLAEIDPRPFQNSLREAEGQLAKDKALLANAKQDLARYAQLSRGDYIAAQQVETQRSLVQQYEGVVRSDEAQVASAALQLEYSRITAPMDGRLGLKQVDEGNMIRASDTTGIVRITRTEPSDVVFTLPETDLPDVLAGQKDAAARGERLPVQAWDRELQHPLADGYLLSVDNQIDPGTGTIKLKARFPNTDERLFPNQFVNARLQVQVRKNATLVPSAAVQLGAKGSFVYVVRDGTARLQTVAPGWRANDVMVVDSGLAPGDTVVVDGVDRLRDGAPVTVQQ